MLQAGTHSQTDNRERRALERFTPFIRLAAKVPTPVSDFTGTPIVGRVAAPSTSAEDRRGTQVRVTQHPPYASELWPSGLRPGSDGQRVYLPVMREGAVRALLPMDAPRAAQSAVRNASAPQSRRAYVQRALAGAGLRAVLRPRLLPLGARALLSTVDDSLEQEMARWAGLETASIAVHFGPPRANLKPVAKIYDDRTGQSRAVVKFGCTSLTRQLVAKEAGFLRALDGAGTAALEIPSLIHEGTWGASSFVMQSVIRFPGRHRLPSPTLRVQAEQAVASTGTLAVGPLRDGSYHADLSERLLALAGDPVSRTVAAAGHRLLEDLGDERISTGGWHGDWAPQNLCATESGVGAWDWERWAPDRPCGFDSLHYRAQELLAGGGAPHSVGLDLIEQAPTLVAPHQPELDRSSMRRLAALYLVEIGHRYLTDGQRDTPSMAGRMDTWLVPALVSAANDEPRRNELT